MIPSYKIAKQIIALIFEISTKVQQNPHLHKKERIVKFDTLLSGELVNLIPGSKCWGCSEKEYPGGTYVWLLNSLVLSSTKYTFCSLSLLKDGEDMLAVFCNFTSSLFLYWLKNKGVFEDLEEGEDLQKFCSARSLDQQKSFWIAIETNNPSANISCSKEKLRKLMDYNQQSNMQSMPVAYLPALIADVMVNKVNYAQAFNFSFAKIKPVMFLAREAGCLITDLA